MDPTVGIIVGWVVFSERDGDPRQGAPRDSKLHGQPGFDALSTIRRHIAAIPYIAFAEGQLVQRERPVDDRARQGVVSNAVLPGGSFEPASCFGNAAIELDREHPDRVLYVSREMRVRSATAIGNVHARPSLETGALLSLDDHPSRIRDDVVDAPVRGPRRHDWSISVRFRRMGRYPHT
jgi:hypothetical protein